MPHIQTCYPSCKMAHHHNATERETRVYDLTSLFSTQAQCCCCIAAPLSKSESLGKRSAAVASDRHMGHRLLLAPPPARSSRAQTVSRISLGDMRCAAAPPLNSFTDKSSSTSSSWCMCQQLPGGRFQFADSRTRLGDCLSCR